MTTCARLRIAVLGVLVALGGVRPSRAADAPTRREVGQVVLEGVPEIPDALRERMNKYLNVRAASFLGFSDDGERILIRDDHVIVDMLTGLGASVRKVRAPFDPEGGAYGQHNHDPDHRHGALHAERHG